MLRCLLELIDLISLWKVGEAAHDRVMLYAKIRDVLMMSKRYFLVSGAFITLVFAGLFLFIYFNEKNLPVKSDIRGEGVYSQAAKFEMLSDAEMNDLFEKWASEQYRFSTAEEASEFLYHE